MISHLSASNLWVLAHHFLRSWKFAYFTELNVYLESLKKCSRATLRFLAGRIGSAGRTLPRPNLDHILDIYLRMFSKPMKIHRLLLLKPYWWTKFLLCSDLYIDQYNSLEVLRLQLTGEDLSKFFFLLKILMKNEFILERT